MIYQTFQISSIFALYRDETYSKWANLNFKNDFYTFVQK